MSVKRYEKNPILTKENVPFKVNSIFNAAPVLYQGNYLLLCRVEMPTGRSSFVMARSTDGKNYEVDKKLCLTPEAHGDWYEYVSWGIEDPRITLIDDEYYVLYTGYSKYMPLVMMAKTNDFDSFEVIGPVTEPSNKDAALFPEKINGYYYKVDRPSAEDRRDIWISKSPDLIHWGDYRFLMEGAGGTWEQNKIGNSSQPERTDQGWLMLYHGVRGFGVSSSYKLGVVLLDLEKPWIVKGKSEEPILSPEFDYERIGDVGNVIFSTGMICHTDGTVNIYYSGADMNICLATTTVEYLQKCCVK
jgi:predicted GH43/DUF377 family glycosyl hydrolase